MGDAEGEGALPDRAPTKGGNDTKDENAQAGNETAETTENAMEESSTAIENEAPGLVVESSKEDVSDTGESRVENGVEKAAPEDGTSRIGTGAESCLAGAETDDMYRRVRELALEAINAVRAAWGAVLKR